MNILLSVSDLHVGGAQTLVLALANQLATRHQVYLYNYNLFSLQQRPLAPQLADNIQLCCLPWWLVIIPDKLYWLLERVGISRRSFLWVNGLRRWHLRQTIRHCQIDIVSSHLFDADYLVATTLPSQSIHFVVTDHGDYQYLLHQRPAHQWAVQTILSQASTVVYIAERNAQSLQQLVETDKLHKIYNGIALNTSDFNPRAHLKLSDDAFVFGMVARGIPAKGWAAAIQGLELVYQAEPLPHRRAIHLVLVGDSAYLRRLKQQLPRPLGQVVHFVGHANYPLDWIKGFDVGLLPSHFAGESLPMVVAEYLSQKKPVIASNLGGIAEMLSDPPRLAGTLLTPMSTGKIAPMAIAQAMQRYLQSPQLLQEQATNAAFIFQKKFNIQTCASAYESLFQTIVHSPQRPASESIVP